MPNVTPADGPGAIHIAPAQLLLQSRPEYEIRGAVWTEVHLLWTGVVLSTRGLVQSTLRLAYTGIATHGAAYRHQKDILMHLTTASGAWVDAVTRANSGGYAFDEHVCVSEEGGQCAAW